MKNFLSDIKTESTQLATKTDEELREGKRQLERHIKRNVSNL